MTGTPVVPILQMGTLRLGEAKQPVHTGLQNAAPGFVLTLTPAPVLSIAISRYLDEQSVVNFPSLATEIISI